MLADGRELIAVAPWVALFPGALILAFSLGANLLADGMQDATNPRRVR
jgi:peptide/nickel transport system permease protein